MASSSDQSFSLSGSGLWRRSANSSQPRPPTGGPLQLDIDPPPKPRPVLQFVAFGLFVVLACLQLLPATHFRHPADPHRNWIPFDSDLTAARSSNPRAPDEGQSADIKHDGEGERIHIFSWTDCLDLRVLAVLANSTLSNSRFPEHIYFHFFVPEGEDEKLSYYKLKVLLPHSNLFVIGQNEVEGKLRKVLPESELLWPPLRELIPLIIPSIYPSLSRFIYVSSDTMIKGNIEELFVLDLGPYAIAAAEDCSQKLGKCVNIDVLNAIQRTATKSWVSGKPYDKNDCTPDFNVLLVDARKLDKELVEAVLWWNKALYLEDERSKQMYPAIGLAIYGRYLKLPSAWKLGDSMRSKLDDETAVLRYDGPVKVCAENRNKRPGLGIGSIWRHYLPSKSDAILAH